MNTWLGSVLLSATIACGGCSLPLVDNSDKAEEEKTAKAHDAWMVGGWSWSEDSGADTTSANLSLRADGTGSRSWLTSRHYIDYGFGDTASNETIEWWSDNGALVINGVRHELTMTPNCRLVKMDDLVYTHTPEGPCAQPSKPLTPLEAKLVGEWEYEARGSYSDTYIHVYVTDDRNISYFTDDTSGVESSYFTVDADGLVHGTGPDGDENLGVMLDASSGGLHWCKFRDKSSCVTLRKTK